MEEFERTKRQAERLKDNVDKLWCLPLVARLRNEGAFQSDGLLGSPVPLAQNRLSDLLRLPDLARESQSRGRPGFKRNLTNVYQYIEEKTGRWHDREMAQILYDITPNKPTQDSLKEWRSEQGLTHAKR
jgi:hypothetical protein